MNQKIYQFDGFVLDQYKRQLLFDKEPIDLASKTFEILSLLVRNSGEIVEKEDIFKTVWANSFVEESNLPVHISALRKIFKETGKGKDFIKTVSGRGYIFTAQVLELSPGQLELFHKSPARILSANAEANHLYQKGHYIIDTISTRIKLESDLYQAIKFFNSALKLDPNFVEAYIGIANALIYLNVFTYLSKEEVLFRCSSVIQQAKAISHDIAEIYSLEAEINLLINLNIPQAEKAALKAVKLDSTNARANYVLGVLNLCLDKIETAHTYFIKASEINPTNISYRNALIRVHYYSQDFNKAIMKAKEVLEMDGRSFAALFTLSLSYARLGIYDEALKYCDEILKYIDNIEVWLLRAYILALQNQTDEADRLINEILTDEKQRCACLFYIVLIYTIQDRFDEAFDLLFKYCDRADISILTIKVEPGLKKLHKDKRFPIILDRLKLI